jgi:5-formyltetrahydrofolate cyclo-ligase
MNEQEPFSEELRLELARRAKKQIRARMKALRNSYPRAALAERSERIAVRLSELEVFQGARSVALFWPIVERGEVDLRGVFARCLERGVKTFFPFMEPGEGSIRTGFKEVRSEADLIERGQSFREPNVDGPAARPGEIDVVLVPALAADARGHRIGYGAGYYDATLGDVAPPARVIVVAYDFQLLAELPTERHDIAADFVVTESRVLQVPLEVRRG